MLFQEGNKLIRKSKSEILCIEPWGHDSLRVRATYLPDFLNEDWALEPQKNNNATVEIENRTGILKNGKITAKLHDQGGILMFYNQKGELLLKEYARDFGVEGNGEYSLRLRGRKFKPIPGGDYNLILRFEAQANEKIYGMGQYQQEVFDLKGSVLELAHRNSQASVPFMMSSLGYGFLWNNPAVGCVVFGKNRTEWEAKSTKQMDYWITAGDTPSDIEQNYANVTGKVPMMPEYGLGLWQCKLRYLDQEELLNVAREYKKRNIPLDVIVSDFFHWTEQGDWKFDPAYWPDPKKMTEELEQMGTKLMVSIWPTVAFQSENFGEMEERGLLVRADRGQDIQSLLCANTRYYDATNEEAAKFIWDKAKANYYDKGVALFWLDEAEPEIDVYDYDNYRYQKGPVLQVGNIYPKCYSKAFYDGMKKEGKEEIVNLVRCAWAGSQKYGALVWSGDIDTTFESFRTQVCIGMHMGIAGIPWWTTDIGGFHGGDPNDEKFRELIIRWFQFGAFSPVFRMHGDRRPYKAAQREGIYGSGADNEIWSYGDTAYKIFTKYINLREKMRPYIRTLMKNAHEIGDPVIRTLFYEFPKDQSAWDIQDEYMFGSDILVCPVLYEGQTERSVYLPQGAAWLDTETEKTYEGGQTIAVSAALDTIPVFLRDGNQKEIFIEWKKSF